MSSLSLYFMTSYTDPGLLKNYKMPIELHAYTSHEISGDPHVIRHDAKKSESHLRAVSTQQEEIAKLGSVEEAEDNYEDISEEDEQEDESDEESDTHEISNVENAESQEERSMSIIIESRYCTLCNIEQPVRAKHCRDCQSCVALHDHHCPWVGVCIGERNRRVFWWYLLFQTSLLWQAGYLLGHSIRYGDNSFVLGVLITIALIVIGFFGLMVTCLLGFHTYLAIHNQTTWETASWNKISYLKDWPRQYHSPFSRGMWANLYFYCCKSLKGSFIIWVVPSVLPSTVPRCYEC